MHGTQALYIRHTFTVQVQYRIHSIKCHGYFFANEAFCLRVWLFEHGDGFSQAQQITLLMLKSIGGLQTKKLTCTSCCRLVCFVVLSLLCLCKLVHNEFRLCTCYSNIRHIHHGYHSRMAFTCTVFCSAFSYCSRVATKREQLLNKSSV